MNKLRHLVFCYGRATLIGLLIVIVNGVASAATIRGRLEHRLPNGSSSPAAGVKVTVYNSTVGRSSAYSTGPDGMYYFTVPAGVYKLEVWLSTAPSAQPLAYQIKIVEPHTDIPTIVLP